MGEPLIDGAQSLSAASLTIASAERLEAIVELRSARSDHLWTTDPAVADAMSRLERFTRTSIEQWGQREAAAAGGDGAAELEAEVVATMEAVRARAGLASVVPRTWGARALASASYATSPLGFVLSWLIPLPASPLPEVAAYAAPTLC